MTATTGSTQTTELTRVRNNIGTVVIEFCRRILLSGRGQFVAKDLREFVALEGNTAPASPDRVLRDLRKRGLLDYRVINRRASLYEVLSVTV